LPHDAGVESISGLQQKWCKGCFDQSLNPNQSQFESGLSGVYQYPEEECNLKGVLEEYEVD
jgi:hypothetical protein